MHECAICGAVHAICMCNMNPQYAVQRPVVASHDFHHFQKAAIAKYAPSVCARRCIPLKIFFCKPRAWIICNVHRSCVSRLRDSDLLANSVSCSMACNGGSWSKYTMASSTSSSSPTQPLGPKTSQVKRMQSHCEGLTMLILIFIMMKITQMMIMQG